VHRAAEEGVDMQFLVNPVEFLGDDKGRLVAVKCQRQKLGEPDSSGRARPVPIEGDFFTLELDTCVVAIGNDPNPLISRTTPELKVTSLGGVVVDEKTGATSIPGVYAGGDIVTGAATVIEAMGAGRKAARAMKAYLGLRDTEVVYAPEAPRTGRRFGFAADEHGYARVRVA
jgi:glutamate synthase (NADPH/NADH) small chain